MKVALLEFTKSAIELESPAIQVEKLTIDLLKSAIRKQNYKEPTPTNIIRVYENIDANQVFSTNIDS